MSWNSLLLGLDFPAFPKFSKNSSYFDREFWVIDVVILDRRDPWNAKFPGEPGQVGIIQETDSQNGGTATSLCRTSARQLLAQGVFKLRITPHICFSICTIHPRFSRSSITLLLGIPLLCPYAPELASSDISAKEFSHPPSCWKSRMLLLSCAPDWLERLGWFRRFAQQNFLPHEVGRISNRYLSKLNCRNVVRHYGLIVRQGIDLHKKVVSCLYKSMTMDSCAWCERETWSEWTGGLQCVGSMQWSMTVHPTIFWWRRFPFGSRCCYHIPTASAFH